MLSTLVKFSADNILKYFSYFSGITGFEISCKFSPCQNLFPRKNKEKIINVLSADLAQRVVKVEYLSQLLRMTFQKTFFYIILRENKPCFFCELSARLVFL